MTFTVAPTSRFGHSSDTVLAAVEMQIHNTGSERIEFPFMVLSTDSGANATAPESVEPRVLNGSQPVVLDEVDEAAAAEEAVRRVAAGGADAATQEAARQFVLAALRSAERRKIGRTHIEAGAQRRIVLQQRLRVLPDPTDGAFVFQTVAPSPLLTTPGRWPGVCVRSDAVQGRRRPADRSWRRSPNGTQLRLHAHAGPPA